MSIARGGPVPEPAAMEVEDSVPVPEPVVTDAVVPASPTPITPTLQALSISAEGNAAGNVQERSRKQSISFLLNRPSPSPTPGGSAHPPQNPPRVPDHDVQGLGATPSAQYSGHASQTVLSPGRAMPPPQARNDRTLFQHDHIHPARTVYPYAVPHGVNASPGGRSVSEHGSFRSPRSCIGGPSNWRLGNTPSAPSIASQSPVTPFWDSPAPSRRIEEVSPVIGESQAPENDPMQFELPPSHRMQRESYGPIDAREPHGTFAPHVEARGAFQRADRGNQGVLDFRDFLEAIRSLNVPLAHQEARIYFFHRLDRDRDERITEEEFVNGYLNGRFSLSPRR